MTAHDPGCLSCSENVHIHQARNDAAKVTGAHTDTARWCEGCLTRTTPYDRFHLLQSRRVTSYVWRRAGRFGPHAVEEIAQETFVQLWSGFDRMEKPERVMFTIARRVIYAKAPEYTQEAVVYDGDQVEDPEAAKLLEDIELAEQVSQALDGLPKQTRDYLWDHKAMGESADSVARKHGVRKSTITKSTGRGLQKLKEFDWLPQMVAVIWEILRWILR